MIEAHGLTKRFDNLVAVDDLSLTVAAGEVLALLGPNGAGKTTTVRMLAAILRPSKGRAIVAGHDVLTEPAAVRRKIGLLTEYPGLYRRMYGGEYLDFFGRLYGLDAETRQRRARRLLEQFGMPEAWDRRIGEYSKGMQQKLALARAMLHDPPVLLLDEPTSAMDPYSAKLVRDAILSLRNMRRAIVVCTHNLAEAELLADRIAIIRRGRLVAIGTPAELKRELVGPPLMELHLKNGVGRAYSLVSQLAHIVATDGNRIWYETETPETTNPLILRALVAADVEVITLARSEWSLEDVYLRIVGSTQ
ncbi:MAG TPA: ABC transporter ATP-binding protein [Chloroflexi bacterium]|nr:ABC transporter ATP-binding protein [Chloroflexota bacterium]